jgi:hypothetical protein
MTGNSYGSFTAAASAGSYSLTLPWDQINVLTAINATPLGVDRVFRAEFFDMAGHKAVREVTVKLRCNPKGSSLEYACCNGASVLVNRHPFGSSYEACGTCDHNCQQKPPTWGSNVHCSDFRCEWTGQSTTPVSCDTYCASVSAHCTDPTKYSFDDNLGFAQYSNGTTTTHVLLYTCAQLPPATQNGLPLSAVYCDCVIDDLPPWYSQLP